MPAFEWVHVQLHQQKGMISLSPPTICNSAIVILCSFATIFRLYRQFTSLAVRRDGKGDPSIRISTKQAIFH
ncbi:hypothetical protein ACVUGH_24610, partial [Salmonella enterica subsp. enterica serovar Typhimurium]